MNNLLKYWFPLIAVLTLIFIGSSLPGQILAQEPLLPTLPSTLEHMAEFFILGVFMYRALKATKVGRFSLELAVLLGSFYGFTDEFHQLFVPGRVCSPLDLVFDIIGCVIGVLLMRLVVSVRRIKQTDKDFTHSAIRL